jgi:hypothetical protein
MNTNRRLGRIRISDAVLRDFTDPRALLKVFAGSIPLDVERNWTAQHSDFLIWNEAFSTVEAGTIIPFYNFTAQRLETGEIKASFELAAPSPNSYEALMADIVKSFKGGAA